MAPLELVQSEATIALREEEIIQAETRLGDAQDELRRLLNLPPDLWDATLEPTTDVEQEPAAIDLDQALATAVEERPELARQRLLIDQAELNAEFRRNQRLPRLDFRIGRGTASSLGRTIAGPNDNPDLVNPNVDLLNALEEALGFDFQRYSASLTFAYPLQNREARAAAAQAELALEQALTRLDSVEQDVLTEVRAAVREVNSAVQQIASAQVSRRLQERNLEAEQKRYENGMSTSFQVAEIQEDLTQARSREVAALTNYRIALARYHQAIGVLVEESGVTIVDDVAYTGRTARAAMDEMADFGRPSRIFLCVLVDRGGRELPIQPDFTGRVVEVGEGQRVEVRVPELDGRLGVELVHVEPEQA